MVQLACSSAISSVVFFHHSRGVFSVRVPSAELGLAAPSVEIRFGPVQTDAPIAAQPALPISAAAGTAAGTDGADGGDTAGVFAAVLPPPAVGLMYLEVLIDGAPAPGSPLLVSVVPPTCAGALAVVSADGSCRCPPGCGAASLIFPRPQCPLASKVALLSIDTNPLV